MLTPVPNQMRCGGARRWPPSCWRRARRPPSARPRPQPHCGACSSARRCSIKLCCMKPLDVPCSFQVTTEAAMWLTFEPDFSSTPRSSMRCYVMQVRIKTCNLHILGMCGYGIRLMQLPDRFFLQGAGCCSPGGRGGDAGGWQRRRGCAGRRAAAARRRGEPARRGAASAGNSGCSVMAIVCCVFRRSPTNAS